MKPFYRPEIDGLRAIAVCLVVFFHAFPSRLPGGFIGVDVFFVISGFLITSIIVTGLDRWTFSFLTFYARRIRRIFPALIIVLTTVAIAGLLWETTAQLELLGKHGVGAVLFVPNFVFWYEAGYFDVSAETKPLLHTCSLGVEEQFYIVWPALLAIAHRKRVPLLPLLAFITAASFAYSVYLSSTAQTAAFYSPLSRAWELSIGSIVALYGVKRIAPLPSLLSLAGIAAIVVAALLFRGDMHFPAPAALLPVLGTSAVVVAGSRGFVNRMLSTKPFVAVGLISYPLYLWHWPLMAFARLATRAPSELFLLTLIATSFILAAVTYLLLERPIQRRRLIRTTPYLVSIMAVIGVSAGATMRFDVRTVWYPQQIKEILSYSSYDYGPDARLHKCWLTEETNFSPECSFSGHVGPRVAVWGDSHAARLYPGLRYIESNVAQFTVSSCPPSGNQKPYCETMKAKTLALLSDDRADTVILFARWTVYTNNWTDGPFADGLRKTIADLKAMGSRVIVVGPFPEFQKPLPDLVFEHWQSKATIEARASGLPSQATNAVEGQLRQIASESGAEYSSLTEMLCNDAGCQTRSSDSPTDLISWDYGHLTTSGSKLVAGKLSAILRSE